MVSVNKNLLISFIFSFSFHILFFLSLSFSFSFALSSFLLNFWLVLLQFLANLVQVSCFGSVEASQRWGYKFIFHIPLFCSCVERWFWIGVGRILSNSWVKVAAYVISVIWFDWKLFITWNWFWEDFFWNWNLCSWEVW